MIGDLLNKLSEYPELSVVDTWVIGEIFSSALAGVDCEVEYLSEEDADTLREHGFTVDQVAYDDEVDFVYHISW